MQIKHKFFEIWTRWHSNQEHFCGRNEHFGVTSCQIEAAVAVIPKIWHLSKFEVMRASRWKPRCHGKHLLRRGTRAHHELGLPLVMRAPDILNGSLRGSLCSWGSCHPVGKIRYRAPSWPLPTHSLTATRELSGCARRSAVLVREMRAARAPKKSRRCNVSRLGNRGTDGEKPTAQLCQSHEALTPFWAAFFHTGGSVCWWRRRYAAWFLMFSSLGMLLSNAMFGCGSADILF